MEAITPEQFRNMLQSAIQAPSADNHHPVRFQLDGSRILVHHTRTTWEQPGYQRVLDLLSLGALAENLVIAASRHGVRAEINLLPDPDQPGLALSIDLQPDEAQSDPLWHEIPKRHTSRQFRFRGPPFDVAERAQLDAITHAHPSYTLHWLETAADRNPALALMRRAETERFRNRILHAGLFTAIRFDVGWRDTSETGLPPGALGVELPLRGLFAALRHWPVMRMANRFGAHHLLGLRSCDLPCRLAPNLGVLTVKKIDTPSVFDAGRAFQRIWLTTTRLGRVLQPMPASALYALDGADAAGIPKALQQSLAEGWKTRFGSRVPVMLFRTGRAQPSFVTAGRPAIDSFMKAF
ncbi:MAG: hypothetical protein B7Z35_08250 [Hydrogenophilales bacterium 12-61-10]|nr:MAG: hypothetical protein B7Z35_08250 [Hydrogenophilales bacterium 12-61-10]OYX30711.1 MAG: hypothetical protein B7Z03_05605 [Hydrogenophilales bacterium 32-62-9]